MLYNLSRVAELCAGTLQGVDTQIDNVVTDSRSHHCNSSTLFVAIDGANHDGHHFIDSLYRRGVRSFLIERDFDTTRYPDAGFVACGGAVAALQSLAADHRKSFSGTLVAITGSNGKTVTKEWCAQILTPRMKVLRSPKSYNSQIGVALSLLMIESDHQVAIIEAGISMPGEMERLEAMIRPDIGVITTIGEAHGEYFDSQGQKLAQKLKLFAHTKRVIYNSAYPEIGAMLASLCPTAHRIDCGTDSLCEELMVDGASIQNASMAVAICTELGVERHDIDQALGQLEPVALRLEVREGMDNSVLINDFYNSDINSLSIAVEYLDKIASGRAKSIILSDILQSGMKPEQLYERVALILAQAGIDHLIGIGPDISANATLFGCAGEFYPNVEQAIAKMGNEKIAGRAILIKGNRSSGLEAMEHLLRLRSHTTTLEVDLDAFVHNLNAHRTLIDPRTKIMAMVKASSYGHGDFEIASLLAMQGVDYLAVAFADEGVTLRRGGITTPIVVLNADEQSFDLMIEHNLEPEIYNFRSLHLFTEQVERRGERQYPIHIKLDTGMHRLGFDPTEIERLRSEIASLGGVVRVASIFSHLASADDPTQDDFTRGQIALFDKLSLCICSGLPYKPLRHIANSAAIERLPEATFDICRLGIGLYGISAIKGLNLRSVSTLKTRIVQIKQLEAGQGVGYSRSGILIRPSTIATIPIGYADGVDRRLGNGRWSVMVNGKQAPIVGRVCMDTVMVDITAIQAAEGDTVEIFSATQGNRVEDMARVLETIPYEIMTSVSSRVKRIYTKD